MIVVIPAAPTARPPAMPDSHGARNSLDWQGYYTGTIPCASCEGIQIWLKLSESAKNTRYELVENYLGQKGGAFRTSGNAVWHSNGSIIDLKGKGENRALLIGENFAELLGADPYHTSGLSAYTLRKLESFVVDNWHLLVDPRNVRTVQRKGMTFVHFPAVLNYSKIAQGGHRSLSASFVIDCAKKQYDMPTVKYYEQPFATDQLIDQSNHNAGNWLPTKNNGVLRQAAEQYCQ